MAMASSRSWRKHHAEEIPEDVHDSNFLLFPGAAFEDQAVEMESLHKFCDKIRNAISIIRNLWYNRLGINLFVSASKNKFIAI